jgi:hypothetical protein
MKAESLQRAVRDRVLGDQPSVVRSALAAATVGGAVAAVVYKALRDVEGGDDG